ncbi:hypothetical protein Clacol_003995 [Clathrus columnatus]|uniref:Urea transporter n=1 Tax=Clathrus columnatus TaxID=1419009 RepID=A0AAV5ABB8_9AGAM|nr:hypothetical protein Clacol_003995 [Clathrus columnatus]
MSSSEVLPQGAGYGVGLTWLQARYTPFSPSNSEEFSSAYRSVKPGLIAAGIVSAWTWAATLLQSSAVAYKYGISGPWWYAGGATIQVLLFAQLAAKLKLNAPYAHTWLEIVYTRWGPIAHSVFLFFGLATNVIVSSMLVLGGSATVTDLTGMSTIAACFLIPIGVAIYVVAGGMRATLLCDYTHTTVLFAIIFVFTFTVYATSPKIGSFEKMHELLTTVAETSPVPGNAGGSYLTIRSKNGLVFGVINIIGNFATVQFNDQAYWQRAIASKPATCVKAYLYGGLAWFAIPFIFSTTLGLSAVALRNDPAMRVLTPDDVSAGLPAPAAAAALLGKSGAAALLIVLFLAVTSATAAELIAVSSVLTYDIYKRYLNPRATEAQIMRVSHLMVAAFAIFMGLAGLVFFFIGVSLGWLYMGVILGSAVVPIALCVTWRKANKIGCMLGAVLGFFLGIMSWLVATATLNDNVINVTTTGGDFEMLTGNLVSIFVGGVVSVISSLIWPENFDFDITRSMNSPHVQQSFADETDFKEDIKEESLSKTPSEKDEKDLQQVFIEEEKELDPVELQKAFNFAAWCSVILLLIFIIIIPLPLFFAQTIFGVRGFTAWVTIGIIWAFASALTVIILPLFESRAALAMVARGVLKDIFKNGSGKYDASPGELSKA